MRSLGLLTALISLTTAANAYAQNPPPATGAPQQWPGNAQSTTTTTTTTTAPAQQQMQAPAPATMMAPQQAPAPAMMAPAPQQPPMAMQPQPPSERIESWGGDAIPPLAMDVQTSNGISYVNGGISDEELTQLKAISTDTNLHVLINAPNGEYISYVALRILDNNGTPLVAIPDAGPYVYAKMLPGTYTLETTNPGEAPKSVKFTIKPGALVRQRVVYNQE